MPAPRKPSMKPNPVSVQAGPDSAQAGDVLEGVLQRMGDVLGPGAIYSLVHFGATEEGLQIGSRAGTGGADAAVALVAAALGIEARIEANKAGSLQVVLKPGRRFDVDNRASVALLGGLLEGALTTALRRKLVAKGPPVARPDGTVEFNLGG